ncbi:MAG: hypothetical protein WCX65_04660 [bacterium]
MTKLTSKFKRGMSPFAVALLAAALISGCGGGGGGGGSATPILPPGNTPVQSAWSPALNSYLNTKTPTIAFQTNKPAYCRWSLSDAGFDAMANNCSGGGTQAQSCGVSGLPESAATIYLACSDTTGNKDSAATNTHAGYIIDTTLPTISFTAPPNASGPYPTSVPPDVISVAYSDTGSGADAASLDVSFSLQGRTVSISDMFGRDPAANASSSRTDAAISNPFARTSVSVFSSNNFNLAPTKSFTVGRCGSNSQHISSDGISQIYVWDTECDTVWGLSGDASFEIKISGAKIAAVAGDADHIYVGLKDDPHLYFYSKTTRALEKSIVLPDSPAAFATVLRGCRLFIAYKTRAEIGRLSAADTLASPAAISVTPLFLSSWKRSDAGDDDILIVGWQAQYRLFRISQSGTISQTANLGDSAPKDLAVYDYNFAYVSRYADGGVRKINVADGSAIDAVIGAGSSPRGIFIAGQQLLVSNSGAGGGTPSVSFLNAISLINEGGGAVTAPATDGEYLNLLFYILEDLWQIQSQKTITLTATIKDRAGNTSAPVSISITVAPESPG